MGSLRAREIEAQLKNLRTIENKIGYEFNRLRDRIQNIGTSDYVMRKSMIFRDNYLRDMEKYLHLENFDLLMSKLNSVKNPIKFFELVSQDEIIGDLTYQSDQYYSQQEFNRFVENVVGLEVEDTINM